MARQRTPSPQTRTVLSALSARSATWWHGYDLMEQTGIASGTLYPMLMRLCDQGLLEAKWMPSPLAGRPARHAYRLTAAGMALAASFDASSAKTGSETRGLPA